MPGTHSPSCDPPKMSPDTASDPWGPKSSPVGTSDLDCESSFCEFCNRPTQKTIYELIGSWAQKCTGGSEAPLVPRCTQPVTAPLPAPSPLLVTPQAQNIPLLPSTTRASYLKWAGCRQTHHELWDVASYRNACSHLLPRLPSDPQGVPQLRIP